MRATLRESVSRIVGGLTEEHRKGMAPPACDRDYDRVYSAKWSAAIHNQCFWAQRIIVIEIIMQCMFRDSGFGKLPLEVLMNHVLPKLDVQYTN